MNIIALTISDISWLEVILDLEDLDMHEEVIFNVRYRIHLMQEKRALLIQHMEWMN